MSMTQAAREALRKVDTVLGENSGPLKDTIANFKTFSEWLAGKTEKLDGILGGVERMTGANEPVVKKVVYDLSAATGFPPPSPPLKAQLTIPESNTVVLFDSQKMLLAPGLEVPAFAGAQWSDSLPKMLQEKLIQSFENYDIAHAPMRPNDAVQPDYQLLTDIRSFQVIGEADALRAEIAFSAKIIDKEGKLVAAKLFQQATPLDKPEPAAAVTAFDKSFDTIAKELVPWAAQALAAGHADVEPASTPPSRPITAPRSSGTTKGR